MPHGDDNFRVKNARSCLLAGKKGGMEMNEMMEVESLYTRVGLLTLCGYGADDYGVV